MKRWARILHAATIMHRFSRRQAKRSLPVVFSPLQMSPPGMKMVHRTVPRPDLQAFRGGKRSRYVSLGSLRCLAQVKPRGERRRERAAGAVGVPGGDAVGGEAHERLGLDQEIDALGAAAMTSLDQ